MDDRIKLWSVARLGGFIAALGFACIGGTLASVGGPAEPVTFLPGLAYLALSAAGFALFIAGHERLQRLEAQRKADAALADSIRAIAAEGTAIARARQLARDWRAAIGAPPAAEEERAAA